MKAKAEGVPKAKAKRVTKHSLSAKAEGVPDGVLLLARVDQFLVETIRDMIYDNRTHDLFCGYDSCGYDRGTGRGAGEWSSWLSLKILGLIIDRGVALAAVQDGVLKYEEQHAEAVDMLLRHEIKMLEGLLKKGK